MTHPTQHHILGAIGYFSVFEFCNMFFASWRGLLFTEVTMMIAGLSESTVGNKTCIEKGDS